MAMAMTDTSMFTDTTSTAGSDEPPNPASISTDSTPQTQDSFGLVPDGINSVIDNNCNTVPVASNAVPEVNATDTDASSPLEDCICPICLDYYIDVVETGCHHRFCSYCLQHWFNFNFRRQCPTCRSRVTDTKCLPDLQTSINDVIIEGFTPETIQERERVQLDRRRRLQTFSAERDQTQTILALLTPSNMALRNDLNSILSRNREVVDSNGNDSPGNRITQRILDWWDDQHQTDNHNRTQNLSPVAPDNSAEDVSGGVAPYPWYRRRIRSHLRAGSESFRESSNTRNGDGQRDNLQARPARNNLNTSRQRRVAEFENVLLENLMEEYNYHLQRSSSAYSRVREGFRDFNYHNGRMQQIMEEYQSMLAQSSANANASANANFPEQSQLGYGNFEHLLRDEVRELVDNSAAANILGGISPRRDETRNNFFGSLLFGNEDRHRGRRGLTYNTTSGRESYLNNMNNSNFHEPAGLSSNGVMRSANVMDMEQELRNRRTQLNGMTTRLRSRSTESSSSSFLSRSMLSRRDSQPRILPRNMARGRPLTSLAMPSSSSRQRSESIRARPCSASHQLLIDRTRSLLENSETTDADATNDE